MTAPTVIISLDCEGKWGVADHLDPRVDRAYRDDALRAAYRDIGDILCHYQLRATYAVVEGFVMADAAFTALDWPQLVAHMPYLTAAASRIAGQDEGWRAPWLLDAIGSDHEIATHGATHTPFDRLTPAALALELSLIPPHRAETMVFPRNRVDHLAALFQHGIKGYRLNAALPRWQALAAEFNVREQAHTHSAAATASIQPVPAGHFVNWRSGGRAIVPPTVTRWRANAIAKDAARQDRVMHFWLHPENLLTAPRTMDNLISYCKAASATARGDRGINMTMAEYCAARATPGGDQL